MAGMTMDRLSPLSMDSGFESSSFFPGSPDSLEKISRTKGRRDSRSSDRHSSSDDPCCSSLGGSPLSSLPSDSESNHGDDPPTTDASTFTEEPIEIKQENEVAIYSSISFPLKYVAPSGSRTLTDDKSVPKAVVATELNYEVQPPANYYHHVGFFDNKMELLEKEKSSGKKFKYLSCCVHPSTSSAVHSPLEMKEKPSSANIEQPLPRFKPRKAGRKSESLLRQVLDPKIKPRPQLPKGKGYRCFWGNCNRASKSYDKIYDHVVGYHIRRHRDANEERFARINRIYYKKGDSDDDEDDKEEGIERVRCRWAECSMNIYRGNNRRKKFQWLEDHFRTRHYPDARPHMCVYDKCKERFPKPTQLEDHIRKEHLEPKKPPKEEEKIKAYGWRPQLIKTKRSSYYHYVDPYIIDVVLRKNRHIVRHDFNIEFKPLHIGAEGITGSKKRKTYSRTHYELVPTQPVDDEQNMGEKIPKKIVTEDDLYEEVVNRCVAEVYYGEPSSYKSVEQKEILEKEEILEKKEIKEKEEKTETLERCPTYEEMQNITEDGSPDDCEDDEIPPPLSPFYMDMPHLAMETPSDDEMEEDSDDDDDEYVGPPKLKKARKDSDETHSTQNVKAVLKKFVNKRSGKRRKTVSPASSPAPSLSLEACFEEPSEDVDADIPSLCPIKMESMEEAVDNQVDPNKIEITSTNGMPTISSSILSNLTSANPMDLAILLQAIKKHPLITSTPLSLSSMPHLIIQQPTSNDPNFDHSPTSRFISPKRK